MAEAGNFSSRRSFVDLVEDGLRDVLARLDFLARGDAVVAHAEKADERRQRQALENERGEDDAEGDELHEVRAREIGIAAERQRGGQRDDAAHAAPADDDDLAPVGLLLRLADALDSRRGR